MHITAAGERRKTLQRGARELGRDAKPCKGCSAKEV
jgi:hypothetical protein